MKILVRFNKKQKTIDMYLFIAWLTVTVALRGRDRCGAVAWAYIPMKRYDRYRSLAGTAAYQSRSRRNSYGQSTAATFNRKNHNV